MSSYYGSNYGYSGTSTTTYVAWDIVYSRPIIEASVDVGAGVRGLLGLLDWLAFCCRTGRLYDRGFAIGYRNGIGQKAIMKTMEVLYFLRQVYIENTIRQNQSEFLRWSLYSIDLLYCWARDARCYENERFIGLDL